MLKLNVKDGGGSFPEGWQEVTISNAKDGTFQRPDGDSVRYIDLYFEGYPESVNCRVWSAKNNETGEDFGIGNLFYHANAGIKANKDNELAIDDKAIHLISKKLNVLFYHNQNGFTQIVGRVAPVEQETEYITFTEEQVAKLKGAVERYHSKRVPMNSTNGAISTKTSDEGAAVPF